jgi:uncharacterized RDD family membrane protein YckC
MSDPTPTPTPGDPLAGYYTTPPPPGAGGPQVAAAFGTPVAAPWVLAGWWRRVGAQLLDGLVIFAGAGILLAIVLALFGSVFLADDTAGAVSVIIGFRIWGLFVIVAALIYAPWMMARTNGKTLGRMATGIRVVRANGAPIDFGWAALREVAVKWLLFNVVGGSITFGLAALVDVLWPLWDEQNRVLHDFIVDSRTILD